MVSSMRLKGSSESASRETIITDRGQGSPSRFSHHRLTTRTRRRQQRPASKPFESGTCEDMDHLLAFEAQVVGRRTRVWNLL